MTFRSNRTKPFACIECGAMLDTATGDAGRKPHPGAISICLKCRNVAAFADDMSLRPLNSQEIRALAGDAEFLRMVASAEFINRMIESGKA